MSVAKMNACSVATRPTSKRKRATPNGQREDAERLEPEQHREPAGHEQDDQVAGEDVGEETNGEREQPHEVREQLEHEERDRRRRRVTPSGIRPLR